ncbi:WDR33, partial [Symbiodinium sp. KB8]
AFGSKKKHSRQRVYDARTTFVTMMEDQVFRPTYKDRRQLYPNSVYKRFMAPSVPEAHDVGNAYCTRGAREQRNKVRCIVNKVKWMPNGRYLLTGTSTGELTLWDGHSFQFETLYRIHGSAEDPKAVRAMEWSNNKKYFITGGVDGCVNYRTVQLVTLTNLQAHEQPVRDLSFSPDDAKFCSCSDDSTVRVFDFLDARQ